MGFDGVVAMLSLLFPLTKSSQTSLLFNISHNVEIAVAASQGFPTYSLTTIKGRPCSSFMTEAAVEEH